VSQGVGGLSLRARQRTEPAQVHPFAARVPQLPRDLERCVVGLAGVVVPAERAKDVAGRGAERAPELGEGVARIEPAGELQRLAEVHQGTVGMSEQLLAPGEALEQHRAGVGPYLPEPRQHEPEHLGSLVRPAVLQQPFAAPCIGDVPGGIGAPAARLGGSERDALGLHRAERTS
jgi:hypothetical protein